MTTGPVLMGQRLSPKAPTELVAGRWYKGLQCRDCGTTIAISETGEASVTISIGVTLLRITCPHCDEERLYGVTMIKLFRHA